VDVDPASSPRDAAAHVFAEVISGTTEDQVAWRGGERYVARLRPRPEAAAGKPSPWKADGSYLITGGLGALGRVVARRMVEEGVRHLALVQRSKMPPRADWAAVEARSPLAGQVAAIQELEGLGARVEVFACDVGVEAEVARVVSEVRASLPPLRGVVHAAGLLDDGILAHLSTDRLLQVAAPKVLGAWHLHRQTLTAELDVFACFSSTAALLGSPGQGNYAAANAGMDALAVLRRHQGLPAVSIAWGPWSQVGMAAADARRGERVAEHGIGSIAPDEGVRVLERLLGQERPHLAVVPLDLERLQESWPLAARLPLLCELAPEPAAAAADREPAHRAPEVKQASIRQALSSAAPADRRRLIEEYVAEETRRVLQLAPNEFDMRRPLDSLGIDSLMAVELRNRFESDLPVRVKVVSFLEGSSPADLAAKLLSQLPAETAAAEPGGGDRMARALEQIGQMSDEAVAALLAEKKQKAKQGLGP
jgi:NAD(P)-dependent dehydrogenase (short-subunit alcohol dehydrogenase family)